MRLDRNPANPLREGLGLPDSFAVADDLVGDFGVARPGPGVGHRLHEGVVRVHEGVVRESIQGRAGKGRAGLLPAP